MVCEGFLLCLTLSKIIQCVIVIGICVYLVSSEDNCAEDSKNFVCVLISPHSSPSVYLRDVFSLSTILTHLILYSLCLLCVFISLIGGCARLPCFQIPLIIFTCGCIIDQCIRLVNYFKMKVEFSRTDVVVGIIMLIHDSLLLIACCSVFFSTCNGASCRSKDKKQNTTVVSGTITVASPRSTRTTRSTRSARSRRSTRSTRSTMSTSERSTKSGRCTNCNSSRNSRRYR